MKFIRHTLNYSEIGMRIRELRKSKGLTQEQLAEIICVSPNHVSKIETGNSSISLSVFINLGQAFHVTLDYLMFGEIMDGKTTNDVIIKNVLEDFTEEQKSFIAEFLQSLRSYPGMPIDK